MGTESRPRFRRRKYLIDKKLQSRFIIGFSSAVLGGLLANLFLAYFLIDTELTQELYKIHIKIRTISEIAVPVLLKLSAVTIPSILVISAMIGYFLTRRIELPLMQFREAIRSRSRSDFMIHASIQAPGGLRASFERMSRSLGSVFGSIHNSALNLERRSEALGAQGLSRAALAEALDAVADARTGISAEISKLKV